MAQHTPVANIIAPVEPRSREVWVEERPEWRSTPLACDRQRILEVGSKLAKERGWRQSSTPVLSVGQVRRPQKQNQIPSCLPPCIERNSLSDRHMTMARFHFSSRVLFALTASVAVLLMWFDGGVGVGMQDGIAITNDELYWGATERLHSASEYRNWCNRIPDHAAWVRLGRAEPAPHFIDFATQDLLVVSLPRQDESAPASLKNTFLYSPKTRMGGRLLILDNHAADSSVAAQQLAVPRNARLMFGGRHTAILFDILAVTLAIVAPALCFLVSIKKTDEHGMQRSAGG